MRSKKLFNTFMLPATLLLAFPNALLRAAPPWQFIEGISFGNNMDVVLGPGSRIHLLSAQYSVFEKNLVKVSHESRGDWGQGIYHFSPALATSPGGTAYGLIRNGVGSLVGGFGLELMTYAEGKPVKQVAVGAKVKRNYVVGVAAPSNDQVYFCHGHAGDNVWGDIVFYEAQKPTTPIGSIAGVWRSDNDVRLRTGSDGTVYFVVGKNDGNGIAFISWARPGPNLVSELKANLKSHRGGTGRRGFPDIGLDKQGNAHLTYGSQPAVWYNRYDAQRKTLHDKDIKLFDNLGAWHLSIGLSAVAASDDGKTVLAVALKTDGSETAENSEIRYTYSTDGGKNWLPAASLGKSTHGGEGRRRPRLVAIGNRFYLFYFDRMLSKISCGVLDFDGSFHPTTIRLPGASKGNLTQEGGIFQHGISARYRLDGRLEHPPTLFKIPFKGAHR